ncbi:MOSC domain-containing protein [Rhodobacteraceae bacterium NNCM2]|nr:MOSC domain-containing protein [Coraliihabitans acroporae]
MTLLTPTDYYATITWLGSVADSVADISARPRDEVTLAWEGVTSDCHSGLTRPACVRVKRQYPAETEIRNTRQLSIVSEEELAEVAERMELERIDPAWLGATIAIRGVPDFTLVPPSTRIIFDSGASVTVDTENAPCIYPAKVIEGHHPGKGMDFANKARNKRGVTAWVERPGPLRIGDKGRLHVPPRRLHPVM